VGGNPWLDRRVLAFAHQGGAREGPSSTLWAMRRALAAGASALELDVHATADGELVVCHDPTVDRTTEGSGAIAGLTLDQVQALDNAYWFVPGEVTVQGRPQQEYVLRGRAPEDTELRVPALREVLSEFPRVPLNLDVKRTAPEVEPYEAALARLLREFGRAADVIVASFHDQATSAFAAQAPEICTSAGTAATALFYRAVREGDDAAAAAAVGRHVALQVPPTFQSVTVVDEGFVAAAHRAGAAVHVWTIDDPAEMERLVAIGVDGVMSDTPTALARVLAGLGVAWNAPQTI
jgi:glycerophosphoryl diester phosphodiesterase